MRIGMLADTYKPHISGVTNYISLNKRFLEKDGHEVYVFTFGDVDYPDDEPNIIRTPGLPLIDSGVYFSLRYNAKAQRLLRSMDIVHVHHPFFSGFLSIRYCQPRGIPVIFTNHTRYDLYAQFYLPEVIPDILGEAFLKTYLPMFCRTCDLIIAPSYGILEILRSYVGGSNLVVIPNGVDLKPFQAPVEAIPKSELGFQDSEIILTYMGRLGPEKSLPFLLQAFKGLTQVYDNVGLLIIGDGPERENLAVHVRNLGIEERVRFTGLIPYSEMPRYLAAAHAFVTASVTEVHPLSVIEAMATGLPILGIASPGVSDMVEDGTTGLIADGQDLLLYTALMVRLVAETDLRQRMGEEARKAASAYSIERTSQLLQEKYEELIETSSRRKRGIRQRFTRAMDKVLL